MLEISGNDIAALNDEDLRSLVGMLCESEMRSFAQSTSAVTWGGDQNAADGGIDVRVRSEGGIPSGGFIPRWSVGFQVKKTAFTPSMIVSEMRPKGHLRPSISDLIVEHGAYIIASSGSDTSYTSLTDRVNAMRSAVADETGNADLHLDFYDRSRLATWTRSHPGLVAWVRQKVGRGIPGWQPYGSWAVSPQGVQDEYLIDNHTRLHTGVTDENGVDIAEGIDRIRNILRSIRVVVRLVGLSGVGKTRLVQALFDARLGSNPLDSALVVYTDMSDTPSPQPTGMISNLIASRSRAIVVIDNCAPELHRRVTEVCRASDSLISAITVEYDVQEDEPEGTDVFRLERSSVELVSKLIARRFPTMIRLDVDKIAEFSGGNARIALALANTLERHESVAGLQDEELFKRLFYQRQEHDGSLLKAAQACALLYSFQGEAIDGGNAELLKIAALVGMNAPHLFAKVAQLKNRDVVQRRSVWCAILPHAIANRLARMALREIPLELIEQHFNTERLMKSFSRRLGYLHESGEAKRIADKWLSKNELLADVGRLSECGLAMFENIAPVSPEMALTAIERELSEPSASKLIDEKWRGDRIGTVLHQIAYDASLFDRCVAAMIPFALTEPLGDRTGPIGKLLEGLFQIILSGTHATIEQRAQVAENLLRSNESGKRGLGRLLLKALLQTDEFSATHSFEFGARVRDYGYWPKNREERSHWFVTTLQLARPFFSEKDDTSSIFRSMVAESIGSVWFLGPEVQEQFEAIAGEIAAIDYWQEGWIAVRSVLSRLPSKVDVTAVERLRAFEIRLQPKNIVEEVHTVVLSQRRGAFDYAEMDNGESEPERSTAAHQQAHITAEDLGKAVCGDQSLFSTLLPELVKGNAARLFPFGKGLAIASMNRHRTWEQLVQALTQTEKGKQNLDALIGFLSGLSTVDQKLSEALLEEAVAHETLGECFPVLQSSVSISAAGVERLKRAAKLGIAQARAFQCLGFGRSSDNLSGDDLRTILLSLSKLAQGNSIAIDILSMRFHSDRDRKFESPNELIDAGRTLLSAPIFNDRYDTRDYQLQTIADACLRGADGSAAAQSLCERIKQGFADNTFRVYGNERLLHRIFQLQPRIALDVFFGGAQQTVGTDLADDIDDFDDPADRRENPLDGVPDEEILRWCDKNPAARYPAISRAVSYHTTPKDGVAEWTPLAFEMLKRAPAPIAILETFISRFYPRIWSGSRAAIIDTRLGLLNRLGELQSVSLEDYVTRIRPRLVDDIAHMRKWEDDHDSARDERFE